jgi:hypothetical protein
LELSHLPLWKAEIPALNQNKPKMKTTEYLQHIKSNLLFFNKLRYEVLETAYRLFLAGERKEAENVINRSDEFTLNPELLLGSKDKAVQMLGNLFSELTIKTEQLSGINNIELEKGERLEHTSKINSDDKHYDYNDLFSSYTDTLVGYTIDRVDLLEDLIFKASGMNHGTIHTSQLDKRLELLRPYTDASTALLLDMILSLRNTMAGMMQEGLNEKVIISKCLVEPFEIENQTC